MQKSIIVAVLLMSATLAMATQADEPVVKNFRLDKKNKSISYELMKPATVRIRVGSVSGPLYRTLVNWESQKKGRHDIRWNGMDASGTFNILDSKNFTFSFNYYLPGEDDAVMREYTDSDVIISDNFIGRAPRMLQRGQFHKKHPKGQCRDLEVLLKFPDDMKKTKEGFALVKETRPLTITLPDKDQAWFKRERLSINIFIDGVFVKGEAMGYIPYTWNFDPKGISKGKHLIIVNLKGFNDHIGVGSLPLVIESAPSAPAKQRK